MTNRIPSVSGNPHALKPDRRQSERALEIQRGVQRLLHAHGMSSVCELPLQDGRRADVVGVGTTGEIWIVEIKSSVADFRADTKWETYHGSCDRLYFAVAADFPIELLPAETGLILADRYGGEIVRAARATSLPAARRKGMIIRVARAAAARLLLTTDPSLPSE